MWPGSNRWPRPAPPCPSWPRPAARRDAPGACGAGRSSTCLPLPCVLHLVLIFMVKRDRDPAEGLSTARRPVLRSPALARVEHLKVLVRVKRGDHQAVIHNVVVGDPETPGQPVENPGQP